MILMVQLEHSLPQPEQSALQTESETLGATFGRKCPVFYRGPELPVLSTDGDQLICHSSVWPRSVQKLDYRNNC